MSRCLSCPVSCVLCPLCVLPPPLSCRCRIAVSLCCPTPYFSVSHLRPCTSQTGFLPDYLILLSSWMGLHDAGRMRSSWYEYGVRGTRAPGSQHPKSVSNFNGRITVGTGRHESEADLDHPHLTPYTPLYATGLHAPLRLVAPGTPGMGRATTLLGVTASYWMGGCARSCVRRGRGRV